MKVVLDTNVLASAMLTPDGLPAKVVNLFLNDRLILLYDNRILGEYHAVLSRPKFGFPSDTVEAFIEYIHTRGEFVVAELVRDTMPDEADRKFLEVARSGRALALVTGNIAHFPTDSLVVSPKEFLDQHF